MRAGGLGIVGACDMAVAAAGASFAFTEARIGVTPAMISLTTLDIMDPRQAMRYYLTGETFGAQEAERLGLVTVACAGDELDGVVDGLVTQVRETSPQGGSGDQGAADRAPAAAAGRAGPGDGYAVGQAVRQRGGPGGHPGVPGRSGGPPAGPRVTLSSETNSVTTILRIAPFLLGRSLVLLVPIPTAGSPGSTGFGNGMRKRPCYVATERIRPGPYKEFSDGLAKRLAWPSTERQIQHAS